MRKEILRKEEKGDTLEPEASRQAGELRLPEGKAHGPLRPLLTHWRTKGVLFLEICGEKKYGIFKLIGSLIKIARSDHEALSH